MPCTPLRDWSYNRTLAALSLLVVTHNTVASADTGLGKTAFERDLALSFYAHGWAGQYPAAGGGVRARWEPFDWLGVEVYAEYAAVEHENAIRRDIPNGFNVFVPLYLGASTRVLPKFGFCDVLSFIDPNHPATEASNDIFFGLHAGVGFEQAFSQVSSVFVDVQGIGYLGHQRYSGGWVGGIEGDFAVWFLVQASAGITLHL